MNYDLSKLYINFTECPAGVRLCDHFPELSAYKEFKDCEDDSYIKLAILTADENSPLIQIKERSLLVSEAFKIIGLSIKKNQSKFDEIVSYKDLYYHNAWLKYLFIQNEVLFTEWQLANRDYEYFLSLTSAPKEETESDQKYLDRRKNLRSTISMLGKEKKELEAQLFPDSKAAKEAAMNEARNKIELYAEKYAEPFNFC